MRFPSKARDALEAFQKNSGLSLTALGELVGSDQPAMSRILKGDRRPGRALAARINTETGVDVSLWDAPPGEEAAADAAGTFQHPATAASADRVS